MSARQFILPLAHELVVDLFAGGGGASTGIEQALGRHVDIAVNHDPDAIGMHEVNHPQTKHYLCDVFEVDPLLENVEEFQTWGPLLADGRPCPARKGRTFQRWLAQLRNLGYAVETRELRACDYGTPTSRKRFFLVARCDGQPIVWPEKTHGPGLKPYRTAAECIDWSLPCPSIFERERPLAEATMRRIAHGIKRYVLEAARPFIVPIGYGDKEGQAPRTQDLGKPLTTVVGAKKHALVQAFLAKHYTGVVGSNLADPIGTVTSTDHHSLVTSHLAKLRGTSSSAGTDEPLHTVSAARPAPRRGARAAAEVLRHRPRPEPARAAAHRHDEGPLRPGDGQGQRLRHRRHRHAHAAAARAVPRPGLPVFRIFKDHPGMPRKSVFGEYGCEACGAVFIRRINHRPKRTCGRACADRLRALGSRATQCRKVPLTCAACGVAKLVSPSYRNRQFCSQRCARTVLAGPGHPNWQGGSTSERERFYTSGEWGQTSLAVWRRDAASCRRCGEHYRYGARRFEVHHIAGWAKNPALRLALDNLVLLCGGCHRFVHSKRNVEALFVRR
jgi:DNA (cytosine-5)-methyltransferase 1